MNDFESAASAANTDDEGEYDIPSEALVRPIGVLDSKSLFLARVSCDTYPFKAALHLLNC